MENENVKTLESNDLGETTQEQVKENEMLLAQKVECLNYAFRLQQINCDKAMALRIIRTYEGLLNKGLKFSLEDIAQIDAEIKHRADLYKQSVEKSKNDKNDKS